MPHPVATARGRSPTRYKRPMNHALGIDVGSTNVKVALVAGDGAVLAITTTPLRTERDGDVAEQDAEALWQAVVASARRLTDAHPAAAATVVAVGVCSQYSSIVPVGPDGTPVGPLLMYLDQRGTDRSWAIIHDHPDAFATWLERHGIPPVGGGLALAHVLHLQHDHPDIHAATAAYLEPMDYVTRRLTGCTTATQGTQFMSQLCDNRTLGVTEYDPDLVAMAGVDPDRLPPLVAPDALVGTVQPDVAVAMGIPATAVVPAAMNDSHAGAFATGAHRPGWAGLAIGTTSVLLDTTDRKDADLDHEVLSMPSPRPGTYLVWAENGIGGKALEVVLDQLVFAADALADHAHPSPYANLDAVLAATEPGAHGVVFHPWLTGSMSPTADGDVRGAFLGLSLDTSRADLVRAVIEGIAHNAAWLAPVVETFTGRPIREVAFLGGAARSHQWSQTLADVLDRPVSVVRQPDAAIARAVALVALGLVPDGDPGATADDVLVRVGERFEPDAAHRERYAADQELFESAFTALRPVYQARRRRLTPGPG